MNIERVKELIAQARIPAEDITLYDLEQLVQVVVEDCLDACYQVAAEADAMAKSKSVTDAGRTLHQGMWGGATNSAARIRLNYGVDE
jgi:2-hydroxychromene-2-carboxylate isomerase